jgi:nicotinamidase-related amidase
MLDVQRRRHSMTDIDTQQAFYAKIGFSARVGYGARPAVLVIDMCHGITAVRDGRMFIDMDDHIPRIRSILAAARTSGAPVIFTTVAYHPDLADAGMFGKKVPLVQKFLLGSAGVEIDARLPVERGDHLLVKKMPSAFHGTYLHAMLAAAQIDTTIIVGNSTSGCVRATAVDAISGGFRPIVPKDCVADRAPLSHAVNLFDMDSKYADVVTSDEVVRYLEHLAPAATSLRAAG